MLDFNNPNREYEVKVRLVKQNDLPTTTSLILEILKSLESGTIQIPISLDLESKLELSQAIDANDLPELNRLVTSLTKSESVNADSSDPVGDDSYAAEGED